MESAQDAQYHSSMPTSGQSGHEKKVGRSGAESLVCVAEGQDITILLLG